MREWDNNLGNANINQTMQGQNIQPAGCDADDGMKKSTDTVVSQDEIALLKELIDKGRRQLIYTRILAAALCGILAVVIIALCIIVPPAVKTIKHADEAIVSASSTLSKADEAIDGINSMTGEVTEFIETNSEAVSGSMQKLQNIDFDGLNKAIQNLESVVEPLAKLFGSK